MKVLTNPSQSSWSNKLHQLVVAHVTQKALQATLTFTCKQRRQVTPMKVRQFSFFPTTGLNYDTACLLPPSADRSCPPLPPLPRAPGMGGLFRYSFTLRQYSSSLSVFGSWDQKNKMPRLLNINILRCKAEQTLLLQYTKTKDHECCFFCFVFILCILSFPLNVC